ncbi:MAG: murein biosynthesis integral membrane protein MurJ [Planctomycetaceae bacterium]|nr:murein biosynthesis integral membrane protein MurJ [Planctomycetaceae bacterium]
MADSLRQIAHRVHRVGSWTVVSRVLGMARDSAMAAGFGNGPLLDAFTIAYRLPNLARVLFGEGALATAFLPMFLREKAESTDRAGRLLWSTLAAQGAILSVLVILAEGLLLVGRSAVRDQPETALLISLTAVLLPYVVVVCATALLSAALQGIGRFGLAAMLPAQLNLLWLAAMPVIFAVWPTPQERLFALAITLVAAGMVQFVTPIPTLLAAGLNWWNAPAFPMFGQLREIAGKMAPVIVGLSITQLNSLADSLIAWGYARPGAESAAVLPAGTAAALYFGQRLYQFPLGVFGVALGTVLFPQLSKHSLRKDWLLLGRDLGFGLRMVAAIGFPASAGLILLAEPVTRLLFEHGAFTSAHTRQTAGMVAAYGSGVWAFCGLLIIHRAFFAIDDRRTPLRIGLWAAGVNLIANLLLIHVFGGIALAATTSLVGGLQFFAVLRSWPSERGSIPRGPLVRCVARSLIATLVMSATCLAANTILGKMPIPGARLWNVAIPLGASIATYLLAARLLGLTEPFVLLSRRAEIDRSDNDSDADIR